MAATSVATCVTAIRERLNEPTVAQWTDIQLRRWLNESIRDIARRTFHFTDLKTISIVANTGTYVAAADVIRINNCYFAPTADPTSKYPLEAKAWDSLDNVWWNWQDRASGDPVIFGVYGYSPSVTLKVFPVPTRPGTLYMHCARMPAVLDVTSGSGNIDCPEAWLELAFDYTEYMALRKARDQRWTENKDLYEQKIQGMIEVGDYLNAPGEFIYDTFGNPVPGYLWNSQY